jgi:hypothetical protein
MWQVWEETEIHIRLWCENLKSKRPVGRPRSRWEDMKIKLKETGCEGVDWIDLVQDTDKWRVLAKTAMNLRFPYSVGNSFTS